MCTTLGREGREGRGKGLRRDRKRGQGTKEKRRKEGRGKEYKTDTEEIDEKS